MTLSICLLTRNEQANLPRVLGSVVGLDAEVVVVDTGSSDRTVEVAAQHGAKVYSFAWDDDFAAGRNYALEQATGEWVLWLNPDEELATDMKLQLHLALARPDVLAYSVRVQEIPRAEHPEICTETIQVRLFRRLPEVRYLGRLHPSFNPPLAELARRLNMQLTLSSITVRHHAYLSQLTEAKLRWAARLLERELRDRPGQLHYLIELGNTLRLLKDPRAHAVLAEAVAQLLPLRNAPQPPTSTVQRLLEYLLILPPEQNHTGLTRQEAQELAARWFPVSPPLLWQTAALYFQEGKYVEARRLLEQLIHCGQTGAYDRTEAFDPAILGDAALANLGACHARLGQLDQAEDCFRRLLNSPTHAEQARQHLKTLENVRLRLLGRDDAFWERLGME